MIISDTVIVIWTALERNIFSGEGMGRRLYGTLAGNRRKIYEAPFPDKAVFDFWPFILEIWDLECYILKKRGSTQAFSYRVAEIGRISCTPVGESPEEFLK